MHVARYDGVDRPKVEPKFLGFRLAIADKSFPQISSFVPTSPCTPASPAGRAFDGFWE
jgi:hypothetical protein